MIVRTDTENDSLIIHTDEWDIRIIRDEKKGGIRIVKDSCNSPADNKKSYHATFLKDDGEIDFESELTAGELNGRLLQSCKEARKICISSTNGSLDCETAIREVKAKLHTAIKTVK